MSEKRAADIERGIFLSAYIVRKLHEAKKLSSAYDDADIAVQLLPSVGPAPDWTNVHRWDNFFDIGKAEPAKLKISRLINIIIHSLVLVLLFDERDHVVGFFVTSDQASKTALYAVSLVDWLAVSKVVANDEVIEARRLRLPDGSWRETRNGSVNPYSKVS